MARRGDRQELGQALDDPEGEGLPVRELARLLADAECGEHECEEKRGGGDSVNGSATHVFGR